MNPVLCLRLTFSSHAATLSDVAPGVYVIIAEGETFRLTTSATILR